MLKKASEISTKQDKFLFLGIIAASFSVVLSFITLESFSTARIISLGGFAVALPFLAVMTLAISYQESTGIIVHFPFIGLVSGISILGVNVGFVAAFWHVNTYVGIAALIAIISAQIIMLIGTTYASNSQNESNK